jgi:hypothetical protein
MKYSKPKNGEWVQPIRKGYRLMCCDCGLVHKMDFRIVHTTRGKFIQFRAFRNDKSTALARRGYIGMRVRKWKNLENGKVKN